MNEVIKIGHPSVLASANEIIELDAVVFHDPHAFYKSHAGLLVTGDFETSILMKSSLVTGLPKTSLRSEDLNHNARDREITPRLGSNYAFTESEVCARIEQLVKNSHMVKMAPYW